MNALIATWLICAVPAPELDAIQKELAKLQGIWKVIRIESEGNLLMGKNLPKEAPSKFQIAGNEIDSFFSSEKAKFTIDPKSDPKHMDLDFGKGQETQLWIYAINGEELKMAVTFDLKLFGGAPDRSRPKSFETKDTKVVVITLKREK